MTEKQLNIIKAARKLFAEEGYSATSTSKVAKTAGVSEGLIFRHFKSKEGLLNAIMDESREATKRMMSDIVMTADPREVLQKFIELPFHVPEDQFEMWRLTYAIKWQMDSYDDSVQEPVKLVLRNAFEKLGYEDPDAESELLFMFIDGIATGVLLHPPTNLPDIMKSLKSKYDL